MQAWKTQAKRIIYYRIEAFLNSSAFHHAEHAEQQQTNVWFKIILTLLVCSFFQEYSWVFSVLLKKYFYF